MKECTPKPHLLLLFIISIYKINNGWTVLTYHSQFQKTKSVFLKMLKNCFSPFSKMNIRSSPVFKVEYHTSNGFLPQTAVAIRKTLYGLERIQTKMKIENILWK